MAVHVLAVLAYKEGDPVTSQLLASSVNTHPVTVRRLLLALQQANLVETRKGAGQGSRLSRSPARISLAEIYQAVEGEESFALPPQRPNKGCPVGQCIQKALEKVMASAQAAMERELGTANLADVLESVKRICAGRTLRRK